MVKNRTIAAIATAVSPSGIGIIRLSGDDSFHIIKKIFKKKNQTPVFENEIESHIVTHGYIYDNDNLIDEVLVITMKGPHTYTGEDTVEIDCHGGVLVVKKILETVIKYGANPAEPGEFSKRAFLNGKMDLSQAESVIDLINSSNQFAMDNSLKHLSGMIKESIKSMRAEIIHEIAFIESALDDPEHYSLDNYSQKLESKVNFYMEQTNNMLKNADNGRILKEGIKTVIVGKPNVGKSSFLNVLMGEDRAIVTDIAGTTRDALTESISIDGITLNVVDTAGIHNTNDVVEKIGVEKSKEYIESADLVLFLLDSSIALSKEDEEIFELIKDKKSIIILNKTDLDQVIFYDDIRTYSLQKVLSISTKTKSGFSEIVQEIKDMFFSGNLNFNDEVYITNIRQKNCLVNCLTSLEQVKNSIEMDMPEDLLVIDLMNAYTELGNITGESIGDDLANEIFSKFCMGK